LNWDAIGAIGELAGALGVIVTLAYLARQMRVNTMALQNETTRDGMQAVIDSYSTVIADEKVASIYLRGLANFNALSEVEQIRFHYVCCQRLHAASINLSLKQWGDARTETELEASIKPWIARMMQHEGFRQWWNARGRMTVSPEFGGFVEKVGRELSE